MDRPFCKLDRRITLLVDALQATGGRVAFIGDGINDTDALAQADLGIATCAATESAKPAVAVGPMRDGLDAIPARLDLARLQCSDCSAATAVQRLQCRQACNSAIGAG